MDAELNKDNKTKPKKRRINFKKILARLRLINIVVSERGYGKTFKLKRRAIDQFLSTGSQFAYIRRYKDDLAKVAKFWDDIRHLYPDHKFEVHGKTFYIDGKEAGMAFLLIKANSYKSAPFPNINLIINDEFIREREGSVWYVNDEVDKFMSICDTILRDRFDCEIWLLGNAISLANPYFWEWNITLNKNSNFGQSNNPELQEFINVYVQKPKTDEEVAEEMKDASPFQKFASKTNYGRMSIANDFYKDNTDFIETRTKESVYKFELTIKGVKLGVWNDEKRKILYLSERTIQNPKFSFCFEAKDKNKQNELIKTFNDRYQTRVLLRKFQHSQLMFETQNVKDTFISLGGLTRI